MTHTTEAPLGQEPCAPEAIPALALGRDLLGIEDDLHRVLHMLIVLDMASETLAESRERVAIGSLVSRLHDDIEGVCAKIAAARGVRH